MIVDIVDEDDIIIGHKLYKEIDDSRDIIRVSALLVINDQNEVLLAQRAFTKRLNPGYWGPSAAGTVEHGETYESNIIKEAEEEIGFTSKSFRKLIHLEKTTPNHAFVQYFVAFCDWPIGKFVKRDEEVEAIKWTDIDEAIFEFENNKAEYEDTTAKALRELRKLRKVTKC